MFDDRSRIYGGQHRIQDLLPPWDGVLINIGDSLYKVAISNLFIGLISMERHNWNTFKETATNILGTKSNQNQNKTKEIVEKLSKGQIKLKLHKESCRDKEVQKSIQNKRNQIKK